MKKTLTLAMFFMIATLTFGQWTEQISSTTHEFISSSFIDENTGWIIGFNGTDEVLVKTTDGGATWTPMSFTVPIYCTSVFFIDANHGWITDSKGNLYTSTDGGSNWSTQSVIANKYLHEVIFTDLNTGYIAGENGMVFKTTNGGTSWDQQTTNTSERLTHIFFKDSQNGWAAGWAGVMIHTTDGGTTWTVQTSGTPYDICGISFIDANNGWASATNYNGADGLVIHTTDGGATWAPVYNPMNYLNEIQFINADLGYMVGWGGVIYNTVNGGTDWTQQNSGVSTTLYTLTFTDESNGWAAGTDGVILHTSNGGFPVGIGENRMNNRADITCTPNPVSSQATITVNCNQPGNVKVSLSDITGKILVVITDGFYQEGISQISWNAGSLATGIYFLRMESAGSSQVIKVIVK